jgi:hypothetical protein
MSGSSCSPPFTLHHIAMHCIASHCVALHSIPLTARVVPRQSRAPAFRRRRRDERDVGGRRGCPRALRRRGRAGSNAHAEGGGDARRFCLTTERKEWDGGGSHTEGFRSSISSSRREGRAGRHRAIATAPDDTARCATAPDDTAMRDGPAGRHRAMRDGPVGRHRAMCDGPVGRHRAIRDGRRTTPHANARRARALRIRAPSSHLARRRAFGERLEPTLIPERFRVPELTALLKQLRVAPGDDASEPRDTTMPAT